MARWIIILSLCFCAPAALAQEAQAANDAWARVLERFVDESGRTDFDALTMARADLDRFTDWVAATSPASSPGAFQTHNEVLAYHINAYNGLAMRGVIDEGIPENFDGFFKRAAFFKFRKVVIGGETTSLYDYENHVIRPLGDPRVHFALNCMVRDCPRLPRVPFQSETLDTQLDAAAREFFSQPRHLRLDPGKKTVWVSSILDFYTEDFVASGRRADLIPYINEYLPEPLPLHYRVRYIEYDWSINRQP